MLLVFEIAGGLLALLGGGELLLRGAAHLARRLGMSQLVVGVIVVGFGTSLPELVTCIEAATSNAPGLAIGNIVGSNIANILLILGVAATLRPFVCSRAAIWRDGILVIVTAAAMTAAAMTGLISRTAGVLFVLGLVAYVTWAFVSDQKRPDTASEEPVEAGSVLIDALLIVVGLALLIGGARYLVEGGVTLARMFHISEEVIGLSLIAIGTSLPELATTLVAAMRRHSEIALGNVLGSNIYNVLGIAGITALVAPTPVSAGMQHVDIPIMLAASVGLVIVVATGQRVTRREGVLLLTCYAGYMVLLAVTTQAAAG